MKNKKCSIQIKGIAAFLVMVFVTTTVFPGNLRAAAAIPETVAFKDLGLSGLRISRSFGEVLETREGRSHAKVLILQDAHSVPDAQRNIHNLIHQLDKEYGINFIGVEGASGRLDATLFRAFPDESLLRKAFKQYYEAGELTGGSGAALFERGGLPVIGLEDSRLDQECYARYLAASAIRQDAEQILKAVRSRIEAFKKQSYPSALLAIDSLCRRFTKGEPVLAELVRAMAAVEAPNPGTELAILAAKIQNGGGVSLDLATEIRVLSSLVESGIRDKSDLKSSLSRAKQAYQTEHMEPAAYASLLIRTAREAQITIKVSPALEAVLSFQYRFEKIRGSALFKEFEAYRARVYEKLLKDTTAQDARRAAILSEKLDLLEKLAAFELSREEWQKLPESPKAGFSGVLSEEEERGLMQLPVRTFRDFYESAVRREEAIAKNLDRQLKSQDNKGRGTVAVLVLGGFHATGIKAELEKRGISYALLSPRIETLPGEGLYEQHMRGEMSWKAYLKAEHGQVRIYEAFLRAARDRLIDRWQKENPLASRNFILKEWRDNLVRQLAVENRIEETWRYRKFLDEITDTSLLGREGTADRLMRRAGTFVDGIRSLQASGDLNEKAVANLLRSIHFPSPFNAEQLMPGAVTRDPAAGVESKPPAVPKEILLPPLSSKPVRRERPQFRVTEVAPHETRSEARITPSPLLAASTAANKERVQMRNAGIISVVGLAEFITLIAVGASPGIFLTIPVLGLGLGAWLVVTFVLRYPALSRRAEAAAKAYNDSLWPGKATLASQLRHFQGWTLKDQGDAVRGSLGSGHVMACEVSPRGWLITLYPDSRGPEHLKIGWLRPESGGPFALQIFFPAQPGETSERIINIPGYETSNPLMAWEWDAQAGAQTTPGFHYKVEFQESLKGRLPEGFFTSFSSSKGHPGWQLDFTGTAPLSFSSRSRTESRHETDQKSEGSLVPLSYAGKDAGVEELTRLALEKFQESQEETAILIAGDRAIQALNLISNQGVSPGLRVDISPLVPVLKKFEEHAFDKSGALKDLVDLLEKDPVITKDNFKGLSQALEAVNDMNERTELMLRFIRHEFGYDLRNAVHGLLSLSKKGSVFYPALVESLDKFEIFDRVHNRIAERKAQREKGLSVDYPTLPLYEAALWRQYLYYLAGLEHNDEFLAAVEQKSGKKGHFYEMLNLLHEYLIPFTLGELGMYDMDLGKCAAFALESSEIPKEAVTLDLQTAPGAKIFANDVFFHELLAVMMKNSYLVAQERLEAENVERKAAGLSLLTLKDRPIHLTVSAKPEPVGSLALDLIEVADNVGGISDPEMLSEIAPGSERQKITEINTSRRLEDTGFGLAFVWHIVKLHHGTFHIENIQGKAGRGIRASIRIPSKPIADTTVNDDIARSEAREPVRFQLVWGSDFSKQLEDEVGPSGSGAALRFVYKKIKTIESLSLAERFGTPLTSEDLKGLSEFYYTAGQTAYRVVVKYTTHKRVPDRNLRMVGFWDKRRSSDNQVNFNKAMLSARNAPDLDQKNPKEAAEIKRLEDGLYEEVQKPEPGTSDVPPEEGLVRDPRGLLSTLQGVVDHLRNPRLWKNFEVLASTLETMPDEDLVAVENVFLLDASPELRSRRLAGDAEATVGAQILTNWGIIRGELSRIALEGLDPAQDPDATLDALIAVQEFINRYAFNLLHDDMMSELRGLAERLEQPLFRDLIGDMLAMGRSEHRSDSETGEDSAGDWLRRNQKLLLEAIDSPGTDALIRREDILGGIIPMVNDLERRLGLIKSKAPLKEWMNEATAHAILLGVCLNFLSSKGKTQHVQVLDLWLKTLNFSSLGEAARADGEAFKTVILKNPIFQALLKKAASDSEDRPAARSEARTPGSDRGFAGPRSWHIGYFSLRYLPQLLLNVILSGFMAFSSVAQTVMPTPDPIEVYAPDLESKHDGEVASAAEHLATVKDTRAVEALLKALHGTNSVWRIKVLASALKANGSPEALSGMITECGAITGDQSSDKSSRILPLVGAIASFKSPRSEYLFMSLLKAENKWSVDVRAAAAAALASIKTEVALDALIQALGNDDESQVFQDVLIKETSTVGKPAADKLAAKAGDNSVPKESRKIYDRVLEAMGDSRASANKAQATAEKAETPVKKIDEKPPTIDELIKNWKWEALAARGKDAVAPLEKCLDSKNVEVRFGAAWALGRIGDTHSIHPLIKLLADDSKTVQESAVEALVSIGTPAADAWVNWKPGIFGSTPDRGIEVLARLHDSRALDLLKTNASRNHELSDGYFAAQARGLGALGNPDGVKLLKDILKLDKEEARLECIRSLGKLGGSEATDTLVKEYLSHKNVTVRRVTAESLEKMGWTPKTDDEKAQCFIATHDWENLVALRATGRLGASLKDGDYETRIGAGNALLSIASETDSTSPLFWILGAMRRTTTLSSQETALTLEAVNLLGHKAATREDVALLRKVSQEDMKYDKGVRTKAKEALGEARKRLGEETWKRLTSFDGSWIRDFFIWIKPAVKSFGVIYGFCALGLYLIAPVVRALSSLKRIITRRPKKDAGADGRNPPRMKRPFPYFSRLPIALEAVKERDAAGYLVDIFGSPGSVSTGDKAFLFFVAYFVAAAIAGVTCFWVASIWTAVVTFMYLSLAVTFLLPVTRLGIVLLSIILTFFTYVFVLLIYPWVHFRASIGYYASSAISPKHFFVMESIGNLDAAEKLFGALEASILTKFGPAESRRILNKVIDVADEVRKSQQDVRNFIEVQVPVALELSTGLEDFMMNLDIIKKFLSGGQNLQLFQDKKAFRNFFAAASADLKPLTVEQMAVEVGLLEKRLADDGFSVAHFYSEVFGKYDKQILEGSYGVICDLVRNGVYPTAKLIAMSKEKKKPEREHFYGQLRGIQADIRGGAFRSDNPLHAELEYTTFRRIIDTSRIVSAEFGRFSYEDYVKSLKRQNESAAEAKDGLIQAEVLYAAQESLKLKEFLNQVMERSYSGGRPVWVIPNFSLGRFASIFIEGSMWAAGAETVYAKIGSSETHENPYHVDPKFIRSHVLRRMLEEKPVIAVVDSSMHIDRYPDAYQGYLNLAIALNDVIADGDISKYADYVGRDASFIRELKGTRPFQALREIIEKEYATVEKKNDKFFEFGFWNPRGVKLKTRSSWKTRRGTLDKPEPVKPGELDGPAFIFVNSVLLHEDMPEAVLKATRNLRHTPGYFDDIDYMRINHLLFKFDAQGVHLSDKLHEVETRAMELLEPGVQRSKAPDGKPLSGVAPAVAGVVTKEKKLFEERDKMRLQRLLDELRNTDPKVRAGAAADLGEYSKDARVASSLKDAIAANKRNEEVRYWAVISLGAIGDEASVSVLMRVLEDDPAADVRAEAARSLGKLKVTSAIPVLGRVLFKRGLDADVKREILFAFRSIRSKEAMPFLLKTVEVESDPSIRSVAMEAYLDVGRYDAVETALAYMQDPDEKVRFAVFEGIGDLSDELGDKLAFCEEALLKCLMDEPSLSVVEKIVWSLGRIGTERAVAAITAAEARGNGDLAVMAAFAKDNIKRRLDGHNAGGLKIISGGQTGADRGALEGARKAGIPTGGTAPKGYMTELGTDVSLKGFGLREETSDNFDARTEKNIIESEVTFIFGDPTSPGSRLTVELAQKYGKPIFMNPSVEEGRLLRPFFKVFNIAGNRESVNPGIGAKVQDWVEQVFGFPALSKPAAPAPPVMADPVRYRDMIQKAAGTDIYVLDLDRTITGHLEIVSIKMIVLLATLLARGKKVLIATGAKDEDLAVRLWSRIPENLRKGLFISAENDSVGYGFDDAGRKKPSYEHAISSGDRKAILETAQAVLGSQKLSKEDSHRIRIGLAATKKAELRELAGKFEADLAKRAPHLSMRRDGKSVVITASNKVAAIRHTLKLWDLESKNAFIMGDEARSFEIDRKALIEFPDAVSVNVGVDSPTIEALNPSIIQTSVKYTEAAETILTDIVAALPAFPVTKSTPVAGDTANARSEARHSDAPGMVTPGEAGLLGILLKLGQAAAHEQENSKGKDHPDESKGPAANKGYSRRDLLTGAWRHRSENPPAPEASQKESPAEELETAAAAPAAPSGTYLDSLLNRLMTRRTFQVGVARTTVAVSLAPSGIVESLIAPVTEAAQSLLISPLPFFDFILMESVPFTLESIPLDNPFILGMKMIRADIEGFLAAPENAGTKAQYEQTVSQALEDIRTRSSRWQEYAKQLHPSTWETLQSIAGDDSEKQNAALQMRFVLDSLMRSPLDRELYDQRQAWGRRSISFANGLSKRSLEERQELARKLERGETVDLERQLELDIARTAARLRQLKEWAAELTSQDQLRDYPEKEMLERELVTLQANLLEVRKGAQAYEREMKRLSEESRENGGAAVKSEANHRSEARTEITTDLTQVNWVEFMDLAKIKSRPYLKQFFESPDFMKVLASDLGVPRSGMRAVKLELQGPVHGGNYRGVVKLHVTVTRAGDVLTRDYALKIMPHVPGRRLRDTREMARREIEISNKYKNRALFKKYFARDILSQAYPMDAEGEQFKGSFAVFQLSQWSEGVTLRKYLANKMYASQEELDALFSAIFRAILESWDGLEGVLYDTGLEDIMVYNGGIRFFDADGGSDFTEYPWGAREAKTVASALNKMLEIGLRHGVYFPPGYLQDIAREVLGKKKGEKFNGLTKNARNRSESREMLEGRTVIPAGMFAGGPKVASEPGQILDLGKGSTCTNLIVYDPASGNYWGLHTEQILTPYLEQAVDSLVANGFDLDKVRVLMVGHSPLPREEFLAKQKAHGDIGAGTYEWHLQNRQSQRDGAVQFLLKRFKIDRTSVDERFQVIMPELDADPGAADHHVTFHVMVDRDTGAIPVFQVSDNARSYQLLGVVSLQKPLEGHPADEAQQLAVSLLHTVISTYQDEKKLSVAEAKAFIARTLAQYPDAEWVRILRPMLEQSLGEAEYTEDQLHQLIEKAVQLVQHVYGNAARSEARDKAAENQERGANPQSKWIVYGVAAAAASLAAAIGVIFLMTASTWGVCLILLAAGIWVSHLITKSLMQPEAILATIATPLAPWELVTESIAPQRRTPQRSEARVAQVPNEPPVAVDRISRDLNDLTISAREDELTRLVTDGKVRIHLGSTIEGDAEVDIAGSHGLARDREELAAWLQGKGIPVHLVDLKLPGDVNIQSGDSADVLFEHDHYLAVPAKEEVLVRSIVAALMKDVRADRGGHPFYRLPRGVLAKFFDSRFSAFKNKVGRPSRTATSSASSKKSPRRNRQAPQVVPDIPRRVETRTIPREARVIRGIPPEQIFRAVDQFGRVIFDGVAVAQIVAEPVTLSPDQFVDEFVAAVNERVLQLSEDEQVVMAKALSVFVPALRKQLKGSTGVAFDLDRSQAASLAEALGQFNKVEGLIAILPKELSAVKVDGITTLRLSSVTDYRPALSLQNSKSVPVLAGDGVNAGIMSNGNLFSVVSEGTAEGLSERARDLLDKVSRIAVAVLLAQKPKKPSDLSGTDWIAELLSELTHSGLVANDSLISLDKNGRVTVHQQVLAAMLQQMAGTKAAEISA